MPQHPHSPTTREIAEAANVSHVTVSRALRNHPFVSEATRAKVIQAAEKLGYRPNPLVGILMGQVRARKPGKFVATLAWINSHQVESEWQLMPYRSQVLEGAKQRAEQLGYQLDEFWTKQDGMTPQRLQQILYARGIYGVVVPTAADLKFLEAMNWESLAVASLGPPKTSHRWSYVDADAAMSMLEAIRGLSALGYRKLGFVVAPANDIDAHPWRATFLSQQADWPRSNRIPPLRMADALDFQRSVFQDWLRKYRPDAIIGCDVLLKELAEEAGFAVPKDLGIAHLHLAADVEGWSGIESRDDLLGATLIDIVTASLQRNEFGPPSYAKRILVPVTWKLGNTTRSLP